MRPVKWQRTAGRRRYSPRPTAPRPNGYRRCWVSGGALSGDTREQCLERGRRDAGDPHAAAHDMHPVLGHELERRRVEAMFHGQDAVLDQASLATLQAAPTMTATFTTLNGARKIAVPVALAGFGDAWAALGMAAP